MKKNLFNLEKLTQIFKNGNAKTKRKGLGKRLAAIGLSAVLMTSVLTGCGNSKNTDPDTPSTSVTESTETPDTTVQVPDSETFTITEEDWNSFVDEAWAGIQGKVNNIDYEAFKSALMIFNIQYLDENNAGILTNYYGKGINIENEIKNANSLLGQLREHNTTSDDIYKVGNLLISTKDQAIINVLDSYLREIKNPETTQERVEEIFNLIKDFATGKGKIPVKIGDDIVEVAEIETSKGGNLIATIYMQSISVECQEKIPTEERAELDNSLRAQDSIARIQEVMIRNNAIASVTNPQVSEEETNALVERMNKIIPILANETSKMNVTEEEAKALFAIANINYFADSTNNGNAFAKVYATDGSFDINKLFRDAESAVEKIEIYNLTATDLYDYGHFFLDSKTDILSVRAIVKVAHDVHSDDAAVREDALLKLKGYTQYSSQTTISYQEKDANGELTAPVTLDKNALSLGGNQVVDWITYYTLLNNKSKINNDQFVGDMTSYVSDMDNGLTPYSEIVLMITGYCAENNVTVYDYEVGQYKIGE